MVDQGVIGYPDGLDIKEAEPPIHGRVRPGVAYDQDGRGGCTCRR